MRLSGLAVGKPVEDRPGHDPGVGGATSLTSTGDACVTDNHKMVAYDGGSVQGGSVGDACTGGVEFWWEVDANSVAQGASALVLTSADDKLLAMFKVRAFCQSDRVTFI